MPTLSKGGVCTWRIKPARSRSRPSCQAFARSEATRVCSRLRGVPSAPARTRALVAVPDARSASASASSRWDRGGAAKELRIETGRPARLPGVNMENSAALRRRSMREASCPQAPIPFDQVSAWCAANASADRPARRASSSSIHGRNSDALSRGNVRSRLPRSPLGSMAITGTPSMAASSISPTHRPVLPLPVIPTHTAWVTRSRES